MENASIIYFFSIGGSEIFLVLFFILIFFGSKGIPEIARGLGKGIREFKNASNSIQNEITKTINETERKSNIKKHIENQLDIDIDKDLKIE
jgi:sec-independent protein translocase protein TatA